MKIDYTPDKPNWCYSYVDIPNLKKIQEELFIARKVCSTPFQNNPYYINFSKETIQDHIPTVLEYLRDIGVEEKLLKVKFSSILPPGQGFRKVSNIHVDVVDKHFKHSLNIPIIDCENTYTIWYRGNIRLPDPKMNPFLGANANPMEYFGVVDDHEAKEICRVETVRPMIINTTIPHRGEWHLRPSRVLCCINFTDLTDEDINRMTTRK